MLDVLGAFVPGLFFEACLLLGDPQRVASLAERASLDRYTPPLVALIVAFVVGSAFVLWVRCIEIALIGLWRRALSRGLRRLGKFVDRRVPVGPQRQGESTYLRVLRETRDGLAHWSVEQRRLAEAWSQVARVLLQRYRIEAPPTELWWQSVNPWAEPQWERWKPWTHILGSRRLDDLSGHTLVVVLHATGWAGLAARHFAPALHTRSFTALCLFLVAFGVLHDGSLASWMGHPVRSWLVGLRGTFAELKKMGPTGGASAEDPDVPSGEI